MPYSGYTNQNAYPFSSSSFSVAGYFDGSSSPFALVLSHSSDLPSLPLSLWSVNITTYVTMALASVDENLSWETQFTSFVIIHQLHGMLDQTILQPPASILVAPSVAQPNPAYAY